MAQPELVRGRPGTGIVLGASLLPYRCALMSLYTTDPTNIDSRLSKSVAGPQCFTKTRNSRHQAHAVPRGYCSLPNSSMSSPSSRSPSVEAMKAIITRAIPNATIESMQPLPPARPQRDARIKISDDRVLMLTIPPSSMLRLLRSEQWLVLSEALVIPWICKTALERASRDKRISIQYLVDTVPQEPQYSTPTNKTTDMGRPQLSDESLLGYLPTLIAHSSSAVELGSAFNLTEPSRGVTIQSLSQKMSETERTSVEYQKGQLIRRISSFNAPNSKFGPVVAVIGSSSLTTDTNAATAVGSGGVDNWQKAFLSLVEGTLRDGEDLAVTISYSLIRHHMHRLSHFLNAVTQSRLVVLDAGSDTNVTVLRSATTGGYGGFDSSSGSRPDLVPNTQGKNTKIGKGGKSGDWAKEKKESGVNLEKSREEQKAASDVNFPTKQTLGKSDIIVTGLRDWSNCIFGDPLVTAVFSEEPSSELLRGFRQQTLPSIASSSLGVGIQRLSSPTPDDLIEDRENASVRLLLYECYHATVCVIKQFYRPTVADGTKREMEARRRLAAVLNKLAEVDENATKRPRTASVEIWPAKRAKPNTGVGGVG